MPFLKYQLLEAEQQAGQLQEKVKELEVCLETTCSQLREKDAQLEEQKRRERDLLTTITECVHTRSLITMYNLPSRHVCSLHSVCTKTQ